MLHETRKEATLTRYAVGFVSVGSVSWTRPVGATTTRVVLVAVEVATTVEAVAVARLVGPTVARVTESPVYPVLVLVTVAEDVAVMTLVTGIVDVAVA
jgi:hypothetical protein